MNRYKDLADENNIVRHCSRQKLIFKDGQAVAVSPFSFRLRPHIGETYLSCDWLEYFEGEKNDQLKEVASSLKNRFSKIGEQDHLAVINVGKTRECGTQRTIKLKVMHTPKTEKKSYSGVYGMPRENSDSILLELLATEAVVDLFKMDEYLTNPI